MTNVTRLRRLTGEEEDIKRTHLIDEDDMRLIAASALTGLRQAEAPDGFCAVYDRRSSAAHAFMRSCLEVGGMPGVLVGKNHTVQSLISPYLAAQLGEKFYHQMSALLQTACRAPKYLPKPLLYVRRALRITGSVGFVVTSRQGGLLYEAESRSPNGVVQEVAIVGNLNAEYAAFGRSPLGAPDAPVEKVAMYARRDEIPRGSTGLAHTALDKLFEILGTAVDLANEKRFMLATGAA